MRPLLPATTVRPLRILLLVALGAVVVGAIAGVVLVSRLESRVATTLDLATEALETADEVVAPAEQLAQDLAELAAQVRSLTADAAQLAESASVATEDIAVALGGNISDAVQGAADVADRTAGFVERVERFIPGNTSPSLADEMRTFAEGLAPVPQQLEDLSARLSVAASSLSGASGDLSAADPALAELVEDIEASADALAGVPAQIDRTREAVQQTDSELGRDAWILRILVLAGAVSAAAVLVALERLLVSLGRVEIPDATPPPEDPDATPPPEDPDATS